MEMLVANISFPEVLEHFRNKKVFITGHTGFKGAWLSLLLANSGAELAGYALAPDHENSLYENLESHIKIHSTIADIRDADQLKSAVHSFGPDYIFHLAAQPLVRYSYLQPAETFEVNVMGTVNVLESLRVLHKKCSAVIVTTDKVYENDERGIPFKETDPLGGHDPYSSSKAAAEIVTQSYQKSFGVHHSELAIATARAGNVIGGGDRSSDRIIPDLINSLSHGTPLSLRNPKAIRPWQHVLDPLAGYMKLALLLHYDPVKYAGSYNFGPHPNEQLTVEQLAQMVINCWGTGTYNDVSDIKQPHEAQQLRLDITKATSHLYWYPQWDAKTAIKKTIEWYKVVDLSKGEHYDQCMNDIKSFKN